MRSILIASAALAIVLIGSPAKADIPAQFVNPITATTYTVQQTDCSKLLTFSNSSAVAVTLPQAGTNGNFFNGCFFDAENVGAGAVTITPTTSTIGGATTLLLNQNQSAHVVSDSTNYQVAGGIGVATSPVPTIASGACGTTTNGAVVAGSTNHDGKITIGVATTTSCTVTFSSALAAAPASCVLFPANATAGATGTTVANVSSITTANFVLSGSALASANYYYHCS